jgi:proline racemase
MEAIPFTLPKRLFSPNDTQEKKLLIKSVDTHCGGEPARIVFSGVPKFPDGCNTALLKRKHMMEHLDYIRQVLLQEPRGYPCQNVDYIFKDNNDVIQYVIGEQNKIYPLMSGHNTICAATAVLECGIIPMKYPITNFTMEAPAGPIEITARCENGKAKSIALKNAPSFVEKLDVIVDIPHANIGKVKLDIAYGGMWYAVVDLSQFDNVEHLNMKLDRSNGAELCRVGEMIKVACREQFPVDHPTEDYPGVDILVFRGKASENSGAHSKNTVVMSNCELDWNKPETWTAMLDRSPCGTGTCAVMAVMHARNELKVGENFIHESIVGSQFVGTILEETLLKGGNGKIAIIPQIEGSACITQYSEIVVDPFDVFPNGYRVADIW